MIIATFAQNYLTITLAMIVFLCTSLLVSSAVSSTLAILVDLLNIGIMNTAEVSSKIILKVLYLNTPLIFMPIVTFLFLTLTFRFYTIAIAPWILV
jgi:hypothetical protein